MEVEDVREMCRTWLTTHHTLKFRERIYEGITPRILVEQLLSEKPGIGARDYKFFCFHGIPRFIEVDLDRYTSHRRNFYDLNWNRLPYNVGFPNADVDLECPMKLDEMIRVSSILAQDIPFVRVDLYQPGDRIYFVELTFTPQAGLARVSRQHDIEMGKWWQINTGNG